MVDGLPPGVGGLRTEGGTEETPQEEVITLLAYGVQGRRGKLHGFGNAIVPQVCAEFIGALKECLP
jgi:hypothetical protein